MKTKQQPREQEPFFASQLRLQLAMRDWVKPVNLLRRMKAPAKQHESILNTLAIEVDFNIEEDRKLNRQPGSWRLNDTARLAVFKANDQSHHAEALREAKVDNDPIAIALDRIASAETIDRHVILGLLEAEKGIQDPASGDLTIAALKDVLKWQVSANNLWPEGCSRQQAERLLAIINAVQADAQRRTYIEEARKGSTDLKPTVDDIAEFLFEGPHDQFSDLLSMPLAYVWGIGGAGKSSVLAQIEGVARSRTPPMVVIHLDFDKTKISGAGQYELTSETINKLEQTAQLPIEALANARSILTDNAGIKPWQTDAEAAQTDLESPPVTAEDRRRTSSESSLGSARAQDIRATLELLFSGFSSNQRLVFILDTIEDLEVVSGGGAATMDSLEEWLVMAAKCFPSPQIGIVAANRRPRNALGAGETKKWFGNFTNVREFSLPDLTSQSIQKILTASIGKAIRPALSKVIELAGKTVPGNPLLVKFTADTYAKSDTDFNAILKNLRKGEVDPASAQRYLDERLLRHVPDEWARPYVLAAMSIPGITVSLLNDIVLPTVVASKIKTGESGWTGDKLYSALQDVTWLVEAPTRSFMRFREELLELAFPLIAVCGDHRKVAMTIAERAASLHAAGHGRAAELQREYHETSLSTGKSVAKQRALAHQTAYLANELKDILAPEVETDEAAQFGLAASAQAGIDENATKTGRARSIRNQEKRFIFLSEATRYISDGRSAQVLENWKSVEREFEGERKPDVLLRALADTGAAPETMITPDDLKDWARDYYSPNRVETTLYRASLADIITLFTGFGRDKLHQTDIITSAFRNQPHLFLLRSTARDLDALLVADLFSPKNPIALPQTPEGGMPPLREGLHQILTTKKYSVKASAAQFVVFDRNFKLNPLGVEVSVKGNKQPASFLPPAPWNIRPEEQPDFNSIESYFNSLLPIEADIVIDRSNSGNVRFLRGATPEFHAPFTHGLERLYADDSFLALQILRLVIDEMSLHLAGFSLVDFKTSIAKSPRSAIGVLVPVIDRARRLRNLADSVIEVATARVTPLPSLQNLQHIAEHFIAWDHVLTMNEGSAAD